MMTAEQIDLILAEMSSRFYAGTPSAEDKLFVETYFEKITKRPFKKSNCNDCYKDAYFEMSITLKTKGMINENEYMLKNGACLQHAAEKDVYFNTNITDEVAERFLRRNKGYAILFSKLPTDWEKRINKAPEKVKTQEDNKGTESSKIVTTDKSKGEDENKEPEKEEDNKETEITEAITPDESKDESEIGEDSKETEITGLLSKLVDELAQKLKDGVSKTQLRNDYAGKEYDGQPISHRAYAAHVKAAEAQLK